MNSSRKILLTILIILIVFSGSGFVLATYVFPNHFNKIPTKIEENTSIDEITIGMIKKAEAPLDMNPVMFLEYNDSLINNYEMKNIRNPFVEKKEISQKKRSSSKKTRRNYRPRILVNGIISDASKPYAILNGEVYEVGDQIKGYTVQSIQDSTVVLHSKTDLYTIKYKKD